MKKRLVPEITNHLRQATYVASYGVVRRRIMCICVSTVLVLCSVGCSGNQDFVAEPQESATESQGPATEPQEPDTEPQGSATESQGPATEPQKPDAEPQGPAAEPQGSAAESQGPAMEPQKPTTEPQDLTIERQVAAIKEGIIREYPALLDESLGDIEKTNLLRDWAYAHTNFAAGNWNFGEHLKREYGLQYNFVNLTNGFQNYEIQGYCGMAAYYLCCIYDMFGYDTAVLGCAVPDEANEASHAVTLCKIQDEEERWIVQDPTYNLVYADENGQPLDIYEIMTLLKQRRDKDIHYAFGDTQARYIVFDSAPNVTVVDDPSTILPDTLDRYAFLPGEIKEINGKYGILYDMRQPGSFQAQIQDILEETLGQDGYPAMTKYLFLRPVNISDSNISDPAAMLAELQAFAAE